MRELMSLVNDIAPLVKIGWLAFFVWTLAQIVWYRRAHVVTWPRVAAAKPLARKVAPPVDRTVAVPSPQAAPAPEPEPTAPIAASVAEPVPAEAPAAPKPSRRRRRASTATAGV